MSLYDIGQHLTHFWQPVLQQYVVRVLWMVPVYALTSWLALLLWVLDQEAFTYIPVRLACSVTYRPAAYFVGRMLGSLLGKTTGMNE